MKNAIVIFVLLFTLIPSQTNAQSAIFSGMGSNGTDFSLNAGFLIPFQSKSEIWKFGHGIRTTFIHQRSPEFITAPARITTGTVGPQVLFIETDESKLDTLMLKSNSSLAINYFVSIAYQFQKKISAEFNIDVIGLTLGSRAVADHTSESSSIATVSTFNTPINMLLISDNDIGSLNSEFALNYKWTEKLVVRAGLQFQFTEIMSKTSLEDGNNRFRAKELLSTVGFRWDL